MQQWTLYNVAQLLLGELLKLSCACAVGSQDTGLPLGPQSNEVSCRLPLLQLQTHACAYVLLLLVPYIYIFLVVLQTCTQQGCVYGF